MFDTLRECGFMDLKRTHLRVLVKEESIGSVFDSEDVKMCSSSFLHIYYTLAV